MCADCNAARKWINGPQHDEQEAQKHLWRNPLRLVEGGHHVHRGKIEDEVKHVFRAQSIKRLITLQLWGAQGQLEDNYRGRQERRDVDSNTRLLGWWQQEGDGSSGCGVVIKTDWITLVNIAVLLNACTATAAESTGVSVLTEVLDFRPRQNVQL